MEAAVTIERLFAPGTELSIRADENAEEGVAARVRETSPERLILALPKSGADKILGGAPPTLHALSMRLDAAYWLRLRVISSRSEGDRTLIETAPDGEVERLQRRRHFRAEARVPIGLREVRRIWRGTLSTRTDDLSAGGCRVRLAEPVEVGARLGVRLYLDADAPPIACGGQVMRHRRLTENAIEHGIAFHRLSATDEDRIVRALTDVTRNVLIELREER